MRRPIHLFACLFIIACGQSSDYGGSGVTFESPGTKLVVSPLMFQTGVEPTVTPSLAIAFEETMAPLNLKLITTATNGAVATNLQWMPIGPQDKQLGFVSKSALVPAAPLAHGWYTMQFNAVADVFLLAGEGPTLEKNVYASYFHVGELPLVIAAEACSDGKGNLSISEAITVPLDNIPIAAIVDGKPLSCQRTNALTDSGYTTIYFQCDKTPAPPTAVRVSSGLTSASGMPVQNLKGQTSFDVALAPLAGDNDCLHWNQTQAPTP
ncbi:MAG TPA: hypothetical protein VHC69_25770 [Polyangiaceae bacterium]|nr:hypothetical protein [Polyangiaceae bacterium]